MLVLQSSRKNSTVNEQTTNRKGDGERASNEARVMAEMGAFGAMMAFAQMVALAASETSGVDEVIIPSTENQG